MKYTRYIVLLLLVFGFTSINAQTPFTKDSLSVSSFINFNQKIDYGSFHVKFKRLVSDSRCPKDVMCIRAGEAKVLLSIYENGKFIQDQEIIIDASGYVMKENNLAFNTKDFKIYGMTLTPYPINSNTIPQEDYKIEIVFQPNRL